MKRTHVLMAAMVSVVAAVVGAAGWTLLSSDDGPPPTDGSQVAAEPTRNRPRISRRKADPPSTTTATEATDRPVSRVGAAGRLVVRVRERGAARPVAGVHVYAADAVGTEHEAAIDAEGAAVFASVPSPAVDVLVEAPGFVRELVPGVEVEPGGVSEHVVEIENGVAADGIVVDAEGRPLPGASAMATDAADDFLDDSYTPYAESSAAADGSFRLAWLPRGRPSFLHFVAPGRAVVTIEWDPSKDGRVVARVPLAGVLRGVVREPSGRPAAGAEVTAKAAAAFSPTFWSARTDDSGRFAFEELAVGSAWSLRASKSGFDDSPDTEHVVPAPSAPEDSVDLVLLRRPTVEVTVLDAQGHLVDAAEVYWAVEDGRPQSTARTVSCTSGRATIELVRPGRVWIGVDAPGFAPSERTVVVDEQELKVAEFRLDAGAAIEGVVVDDLGAPVAGARVFSQGGSPSHGEPWWRRDVSQDDGTFRLTGLTAGPCGLSAELEDRESWASTESAPRSGLRVVMPRPARVTMRLRVPTDTIAPGSIGATFARVAEAMALEEAKEDWRAVAWTDSEVTLRVPAGRWRLVLGANGFLSQTRDLELVPGGEVSLGEVVFDPGFVVAGVVVDDLGSPLEGATVFLRLDAAEGDRSDDREALTAADGSFRFSALERTTRVAKVTAQFEDRERAVLDLVTLPCVSLRVTVRRNGVVSFQVVAPPGAAPPERTEVILDGERSLGTYKQGYFRATLPAGERTLLVRTDAYLPAERKVVVAPGGVTRLPDLDLDLGLTLTGRIVDAAGRPVVGAVVQHDHLQEGEMIETDEAGAFTLRRLPRDVVHFIVWSEERAPVRIAHDPRKAGVPLVVTLHRGGIVRALLRGETPESTADVDVEARRAEADLWSLHLGDGGAFSARVVEGRWTVVAKRGDKVLATREVDVPEGGDVSVDIGLDR